MEKKIYQNLEVSKTLKLLQTMLLLCVLTGNM